MSQFATAARLVPPDPLGGRPAFDTAMSRAAEYYRSRGALVLVETLDHPPETWRHALLSKPEADRCEKFLFERDRQLYLAAHSLKRLALGALTRRSPKELVFGTGSSGRPFLLLGGWQGDFNISHSGKKVAIAIVARGRVGVDVQEPGDRYANLLEKLRHKDEASLFPDKSDFLRMWTLKESVSKAIGTGLGENFETLCLHRAARGADQYHCDGWACRHSTSEDGYHLAVATDRARMPGAPLRLADLAG